MKRKDFIRQVGTLALLSVTPLASIEAVELPNRMEDERKPFNKPHYLGEVSAVQSCNTGTFTCHPGVDGICAAGTITCTNGSAC